MPTEDLLETHAGLIKRIALHLVARLPSTVDIEDMMQAGAVGLLESAQRFDPTQGANFSTFASFRIRGAMIDELRRYDWSPRSTRRKLREMAASIRRIESHYGREADEAEVAADLNMNLTEYRQLLQDSVTANLASLEDITERRGDSALQIQSVDQPLRATENRALAKQLHSIIDTLSKREQLMLSLYYERELNLKEIGEVLGVSESRVCQIHGQILGRIRARMPEDEDWDVQA